MMGNRLNTKTTRDNYKYMVHLDYFAFFGGGGLNAQHTFCGLKTPEIHRFHWSRWG